jgi:hypothetical protein
MFVIAAPARMGDGRRCCNQVPTLCRSVGDGDLLGDGFAPGVLTVGSLGALATPYTPYAFDIPSAFGGGGGGASSPKADFSFMGECSRGEPPGAVPGVMTRSTPSGPAFSALKGGMGGLTGLWFVPMLPSSSS